MGGLHVGGDLAAIFPPTKNLGPRVKTGETNFRNDFSRCAIL